MTIVRIYQTCKNPMQSGKKKKNEWIMKFEPRDPLVPEPLMGWVSSKDMHQELCLKFSSLIRAIEFAKAKGFQYRVCNPTKADINPKSYGLNFTCPRIRGG